MNVVMQKFSIQFVWCEYCAYLYAIGWNTKERGQIGHQVVSKELINCHRRQTETEHFSVKARSTTPTTKRKQKRKGSKKALQISNKFFAFVSVFVRRWQFQNGRDSASTK